MSEMIERVANAILDARASRRLNPRLNSDDGSKRYAVEIARAAIAAMREPDDAMIEAFWQTYPIDCGPIPIWQSMIDEALK